MYKVKRLSGHNQANCRVYIYDNGDIDMYSYNTRVISISNGNIECTGLYSATTRKHIGLFVREYLPKFDYYDMKGIVGRGMISINSIR